MKFPKDFWWGAAASAPQTEGRFEGDGKSDSTWDYWYKTEPERFYKEISPNITSDVYHRYRDDIKLMKEMNLNSYRTSISWTRLLPDGKTLNPKAVSFYRDYFTALKEANIEVVVNLFHFDMPWWLMEKGGWEYPNISDHFAYYARVAVEEFGDLVDFWTTFNEPIVHVESSYLYGFHYPAKKDFSLAIVSAYQTVLSHAKAVHAMRDVNKDIKIGTILNLSPTYPKDETPESLEAKKWADLLSTKSFLDSMVKGYFPKELVDRLREDALLPPHTEEELNFISTAKIDFLGVNYYQPRRVQKPRDPVRPARGPQDFYSGYVWPERRMNPHRGWEIYPEGLKDIAILLRDEYDNIPWYVSENGMGVSEEERFMDEEGIVQDDYRIEFVRDHLQFLSESIEEGSNCFGYHMWTFVDCWSWLNTYKNRYGFYRVDLETQERTPKKSSFWMRDFIEDSKTKE